VPKIALSDVGLRSLSPPLSGTIDYWDTTLPNFACRVSQGGAKTFVLKIHNSRRAIGRYPLISLADARTEARKQLAEKTLGKTRASAILYQKALDQFLEEKQKTRRAATFRNHRLRLKQHFSFKGKLAAFSHQEAVRRLDKIETSAEHDHALSVAKTFFTWAINRRYITDSPVRGIAPHGHTSRARVLTDDELRAVWKACCSKDLPAPYGTIVKLLILTGQRRSEIAALRTSWLEEDRAELPGTVTKNKLEHAVYLSPLGIQLCKEAADEAVGETRANDALLFPGVRQGKLFAAWSKSKALLDGLSGVEDWTLHDLRRTYSTRLNAFTPPHIVEKLINHVSGTISGVARIYNRYEYAEERKAAVAEWDRRLLAIVTAPA